MQEALGDQTLCSSPSAQQGSINGTKSALTVEGSVLRAGVVVALLRRCEADRENECTSDLFKGPTPNGGAYAVAHLHDTCMALAWPGPVFVVVRVLAKTRSGPNRGIQAELSQLQLLLLLILASREKEVRCSLSRWAAVAPAQSYHGTSLATSVGSEAMSMPTSSQIRPLTSRSIPPIETLSMRCFTCSSALTRLSPSCFTSCFSCLTR